MSAHGKESPLPKDSYLFGERWQCSLPPSGKKLPLKVDETSMINNIGREDNIKASPLQILTIFIVSTAKNKLLFSKEY